LRAREVLPHRTKQDLVLERLRNAIVTEELEPGEWIRLRQVAERFGTSIMPVREALQALASEGMVRIEPHRGAFVAPLSPEEFEEIYMARLGLEGLAARLGAEAITPAQIRKMADLAARISGDDPPPDDMFITLDWRFHRIHYAASGRPRLVARIEALHHQGERYMRRAVLAYARSLATRDYHAGLIAACEAHDGRRAEVLVRESIDASVEQLRSVMAADATEHTAATRRKAASA
jgi:DNA-binding GntR family transcriptional regulator